MSSEQKEIRPWGYFQVLSDKANHKVKRVVIFPKQRLSLQRHNHRKEHWHIIEGEAIVIRNQETISLIAGQSVDIPKASKHRIENPGNENLTFIEVQSGDYFGEDDIERFEDDYGRTP